MLTTIRSWDIFHRCSGKPLEGFKQGSDTTCQVIPSQSTASAATVNGGTIATILTL